MTGRFGDPPTLRLDRPELPFARFLERPRVHYPGVELIADAELSTRTDPYLSDHIFQGTPLLPAVMGLEAMAQVAAALCGANQPPVFEDVRFSRPVHIPEGSAGHRARGCAGALARRDRSGVAIERHGFSVGSLSRGLPVWGRDRLRRCGRMPQSPTLFRSIPRAISMGRSCSNQGDSAACASTTVCAPRNVWRRFHRTRGSDWFARYLPATLALPDPGARDAFIHCVQACIPHATVLPIGVDRIVVWRAEARRPAFRARA